jgi:NAD+ diphosphatase
MTHSSKRATLFNRCPDCGSGDVSFDGIKEFCCRACSFTFFHNPAAAVGVVLEYGDRIMFTRRSREPQKGMLDLPGGFVDPDETAEHAARREVREELDMELGELKYLGSQPNTYEYKGVVYKTCDLFFSCRIDALPAVFDESEIEELVLLAPSEVPPEQLAFESAKTWLRLFNYGTM